MPACSRGGSKALVALGWTCIAAGVATVLLGLLREVPSGGPVQLVALALIVVGWFMVDS